MKESTMQQLDQLLHESETWVLNACNGSYMKAAEMRLSEIEGSP